MKYLCNENKKEKQLLYKECGSTQIQRNTRRLNVHSPLQSEEQGLHQPSQLVAHQEDGQASEGRQPSCSSLL